MNILVTDYETKDFLTFEHISETLGQAYEFLGKMRGVFGDFEPKILTFDKMYSIEFIQKQVAEWLK